MKQRITAKLRSIKLKISLEKIKSNKLKKIKPELKFTKIKSKLLFLTLGIFILSLSILVVISSISSYQNTLNTLKSTLEQTALVASGQISAQLEGEKILISQIAKSNEANSVFSQEEVFKNLEGEALRNKFAFINRTDKEGQSYYTGINVSDREYFKVCKNSGQTYVSDPLVSKNTNEKVFIIASPVFKNGVFDGVVYGGMKQFTLSEFVKHIKFGESGLAYLLNKEGTTIAAHDYKLVQEEQNVSKLAKKNTEFKDLALLETDMTNGNSGFGKYTYLGEKRLMAYAPIENTKGWSMAISVSKWEYFKATYRSLIFCIGISLIILILIGVILVLFADSLSKPIEAINEEMKEFGKGNFSSDFNLKADNTEIGQLIRSIMTSKNNVREIIEDVSIVCKELSQGNFNIQTSVQYVGAFREIELSFQQIAISLSNTLSQINLAAEQVSIGALEVSRGSQTLAQGSTEQAATSQELSSSAVSISDQVTETAQNATHANELLALLSQQISMSKEQMNSFVEAMRDIDTSSIKIKKVIKTIEGIAFETNILALNAAVEAARAGISGKGFAVVAQEVRKLAGKSAEAVKTTESFIEGVMISVGKGRLLSDETERSLNTVVEESKEVITAVERITKASNGQASLLNDITQGIGRIAHIISGNSATAEEGAAAAEELSNQAQFLKELVGKFQLKQENNLLT